MKIPCIQHAQSTEPQLKSKGQLQPLLKASKKFFPVHWHGRVSITSLFNTNKGERAKKNLAAE